MREADKKGLLQPQSSPTESREQVDRKRVASESLLSFAKTYLPHYLFCEPCELHIFLADLFREVVTSPSPRSVVIAAPRGHAKTTWIHKIGGLWCACFPEIADKKFIVLLSDTGRQAKGNLESIRQELETNEILRNDFGDLIGDKKWTEEEILLSNGVRFFAAGTGKSLRGLTSGENRPDLILPDDLENQENVVTPYQRDKTDEWLRDTVMKLAGPKGLASIMTGTVLHQDSVLARYMANPGYDAYFYDAVQAWPERSDLWEEWRILWTDVSVQQKERHDRARAFYEHNKTAMDAGAQVLWPDGKGIYALYEALTKDGPSSFDKEYQNDPKNPEDCVFAEDWFKFWWLPEEQGEPGGLRLPQILYTIGACDPSMGKSAKRGDYSAIIVLGIGEDGRAYVLDADLKRRPPDQIIADIIATHQRHQCREWAFEANGFQDFVRTELEKRSREAGVFVPTYPVQSSAKKEIRIEGLQPAVRSGLIVFRSTHRLLLSQMQYYTGNGKDHDDGPDALEMAYSRIKGQAVAASAPDAGYRNPQPQRGMQSENIMRPLPQTSRSTAATAERRNPYRGR